MPAQQCTSIRADAGVYLLVPKSSGIYKSLRTWQVLIRVLLNSISIFQPHLQLSQPTRSSVLQYSPATQQIYTHWLIADCIAPPRHVSPRVTHFPSSTQRRSPLIGTWTCTCRVSFHDQLDIHVAMITLDISFHYLDPVPTPFNRNCGTGIIKAASPYLPWDMQLHQ